MARGSACGRRGAAHRAGAAAALALLSGCIISTARVRAPVPPPAESLPPLARPVGFDVCPPPGQGAGSGPTDRRETAQRIARALERAGIEAYLVGPPGSPARFTVTETEESDHDWSMVLSLLTFSVVPGYFVQRNILEVNVALRDGSLADEHLRYEREVAYFAWAPLIVHPDYVGTVVAAWMSDEAMDGGLDDTLRRAAADLRERLDRDDPAVPWSEGPGVACPR